MVAGTGVDPDDGKRHITIRRLLLAKEFYLHGLDHSHQLGALNKMIAIHNFHNAIEIVLRAIILHYEIPINTKQDLKFEELVTSIDTFKELECLGIKLPQSQQIKQLNRRRNDVQHDAVEPPSAVMEDWQYVTRQFLTQALQDFFKIPFDGLSSVDLVEDERLKRLLQLASSKIEDGDYKGSLSLAKLAYEWASDSVSQFLLERDFEGDPFFVDHMFFTERFGSTQWPGFQELERDLQRVLERIVEKLAGNAQTAAYYAVLSGSGINLADYKRFNSSTPWVTFNVNGNPIVHWDEKDMTIDNDCARWVHDFVVTAIARWQLLGLSPATPECAAETFDSYLAENGPLLSQD